MKGTLIIISTRTYEFSVHFHVLDSLLPFYQSYFKRSSTLSTSHNLRTTSPTLLRSGRPSIIQYLLRTYYVPGTSFCNQSTAVSQTNQAFEQSVQPREAYNPFPQLLCCILQNVLFIFTSLFCCSSVSQEDCPYCFPILSIVLFLPSCPRILVQKLFLDLLCVYSLSPLDHLFLCIQFSPIILQRKTRTNLMQTCLLLFLSSFCFHCFSIWLSHQVYLNSSLLNVTYCGLLSYFFP